jgi:MFS family permease
MASWARPSRRLLVGGAFAFGVVTVGLALVPGYFAGLALLVLIGGSGVLFISTTNALLQVNAVDAMRGRVMALWSIVFLGSTPIGGPITGLLARGLGVRWTIAIGGAAVLVTAVVGLLVLRRSRVVEDGTCERGACCLPDGPAPDSLGEAVGVGAAASGAPTPSAAPSGR